MIVPKSIVKKVLPKLRKNTEMMAVVQFTDLMDGETKVYGLIYTRPRYDGKLMLGLELDDQYIPIIHGGKHTFKLIGIKLHRFGTKNDLFRKYNIRK